MAYIRKPSLAKLKKDLAEFIRSASGKEKKYIHVL